MVREVVIDRDIRAPALFAAGSLFSRYARRRVASISLLIILDVLGILAAVWLAPPLAKHVFGVTVWRPSLLVLHAGIALTIAAFAGQHLYGVRGRRHGLWRIVRGSVWAGAGVLALRIALDHPLHGVSVLFISTFTVAFISAERTGYDALLRVRFADHFHQSRAVVVGPYARDAAAIQALGSASDAINYRPVAFLDDGFAPWPGDTPQNTPAVGRLADLEAVIAHARPSEVIVADPHLVRNQLRTIIAVCRRHHVVLRLAGVEPDPSLGPVTCVPGCDLPVYVVQTPTPEGLAFIAKRGLDLVVSSLGLVVTLPLWLLIALLIKLDSRGPVLYAAERVGLGQRRFACYKFRTMVSNAEALQAQLEARNEADGAVFKIADDPRITRLGRLLRRTSLDELPQLVNVLKGDMSLVGPRPLPLRDNDLMTDLHKRRHVVLPGLTGLWQTSGRCSLGYDDMIRLDLDYIETWSLTADLRILARTVTAVLFARGAC